MKLVYIAFFNYYMMFCFYITLYYTRLRFFFVLNYISFFFICHMVFYCFTLGYFKLNCITRCFIFPYSFVYIYILYLSFMIYIFGIILNLFI